MQDNRSRLSAWELDRATDDIRGWPLQDLNGSTRGKVAKLLVDTDSQYITAVVLEDGTRVSAHDLMMGDGVLVMQTGGPAATAAPAKPRTETATAPATAKTTDGPPREARPAAAVAAATGARPVAIRCAEAEEVVVQLANEELEIGKRRVASGGVHLETRVVSEPFTQDVALRTEHLKVERSAVDRPLAAEDADRFLHDQTVEITAKSELPIVDKRVHVVEEIVLKKSAAEHVEHVRDTVRHTEAEIIQLPSDSALQGGRR